MKALGGVSSLVSPLVSSEPHVRLKVRRMLFVSLSQAAIHHTISNADDRFRAESSNMETDGESALSKRHTNKPDKSLIPSYFLLTSVSCCFLRSDWSLGL